MLARTPDLVVIVTDNGPSPGGIVSRSLNKVTLIGNLGADPEVRSTSGGNRVATFSLATSRQWNSPSGEKQEKTEWHRCVVWNSKASTLADIVERYMKKGDKAFFYHSNEGKEIVGIAEIIKEAYPDPSDKTGKFVCVDIKADKPLKTPVTMAAIKADKKLADMALVKYSRLSVQPVTAEEWKMVCKMGGL